MRNPLVHSEAEILERFGVNRSTFKQSLRPLLESVGDARKIGREWAYPVKNLWQWELYIATRKKLIEAGEWNTKRPYSIQDMEDISIIGMYEDYMPQQTGETTCKLYTGKVTGKGSP